MVTGTWSMMAVTGQWYGGIVRQHDGDQAAAVRRRLDTGSRCAYMKVIR